MVGIPSASLYRQVRLERLTRELHFRVLISNVVDQRITFTAFKGSLTIKGGAASQLSDEIRSMVQMTWSKSRNSNFVFHQNR